MAGTIRLGIAGWVFDEWRNGAFYPPGLRQKDELAYASRHLSTLEINATFYSHQKPASFAAWAAATPDDFVFTVKGHQLVTHLKRLKDVEIPLANFFASGVLALGSRLGPFCWQLPGNLRYDRERLETFLELLPKDIDALLALARKADGLKTEPFLDASNVGTIRHAIELRHESFATPEVIDLLGAHNVALVTADTADWPATDVTADFVYCRLQGAPGAERYDPEQLATRAGWLQDWATGRTPDAPRLAPPMAATPRDVFAVFVSTDKPNAPRNALAVMRQLGLRGDDA